MSDELETSTIPKLQQHGYHVKAEEEAYPALDAALAFGAKLMGRTSPLEGCYRSEPFRHRSPSTGMESPLPNSHATLSHQASLAALCRR